MSRFRRHSAFTLIELIVVVIVLGLLLAVALPSFFGSSTSAQDSAARQYLTTSYKELKAALASNDETLPTQASLIAFLASGEPQLTFVSSSASNASTEPNLKKLYVEQTSVAGSGGYRLGIHSASGALIVLTADRSTGYQPLLSGGAGSSGSSVSVPVASAAPTFSSSGLTAAPLFGEVWQIDDFEGYSRR